MHGHVDDRLRALVTVSVAANASERFTQLPVWIDTAFNGSLVIPRTKILELGLVQESSAEAILADGSTIELGSYGCFLEWFGATYKTQVMVNDSEFPLLGTMLLAGRRLEIDYIQSTVSIA